MHRSHMACNNKLHLSPKVPHTLLLLFDHPFNGLFSRTSWLSRQQKVKTRLDLNEARDSGVWGANSVHLSPDR